MGARTAMGDATREGERVACPRALGQGSACVDRDLGWRVRVDLRRLSPPSAQLLASLVACPL